MASLAMAAMARSPKGARKEPTDVHLEPTFGLLKHGRGDTLWDVSEDLRMVEYRP